MIQLLLFIYYMTGYFGEKIRRTCINPSFSDAFDMSYVPYAPNSLHHHHPPSLYFEIFNLLWFDLVFPNCQCHLGLSRFSLPSIFCRKERVYIFVFQTKNTQTCSWPIFLPTPTILLL